MKFPVHPDTGELQSIRLKFEIVAPDFMIEGRSSHVVEVPPDKYSEVAAFLLNPLKLGNCRINVEVSSFDEVYLGTMAFEPNIEEALAGRPTAIVANLTLTMLSADEAEIGQSPQSQSGGVNVSGGHVRGGGDIVGRDKVVLGYNIYDIVAGAVGAIGDHAQVIVVSDKINKLWDDWRNQMVQAIGQSPAIPPAVKQDAIEHVEKIQQEAKKGDQADLEQLEDFINRLIEYGPDIFDVAMATLMSPLAGIGLALKKDADRAKLERVQHHAADEP